MQTKKNPLLIILGVSFVFFMLFLAASMIYLKNLTSERDSKIKAKFATKSKMIGIIEVNGPIMDSKKHLERIEKFKNDPMIKGVLVRLNSPGGAVAPSQEIYSSVKELGATKPVYASMGNIAASGAYYIAAGAQKIYANPGTITASIGVIMQFADLSKLYHWAKVNPYVIKTGKYKDIGSPSREMSEEEKQMLLGMSNNVLEQFRRAIMEGRKMSHEEVVAVSDGRIMSGEQAKQVKLVDDVGGFNEAVEALAKQAGIEGKPTLVYATKKKKWFERLVEENEDDYDLDESSAINGLAGKLGLLLKLLDGVPSEKSFKYRFSGPLFILPGTTDQ